VRGLPRVFLLNRHFIVARRARPIKITIKPKIRIGLILKPLRAGFATFGFSHLRLVAISGEGGRLPLGGGTYLPSFIIGIFTSVVFLIAKDYTRLEKMSRDRNAPTEAGANLKNFVQEVVVRGVCAQTAVAMSFCT